MKNYQKVKPINERKVAEEEIKLLQEKKTQTLTELPCREVQSVFPTVGVTRLKQQCRRGRKSQETPGEQLSNWTLVPLMATETILGEGLFKALAS